MTRYRNGRVRAGMDGGKGIRAVGEFRSLVEDVKRD